MQSFLFSNPKYLGPSNTLSLGTIFENRKYIKRVMDSTVGFDDSEKAQVIFHGEYTPCSNIKDLTISFKSFIGAEFNFPDSISHFSAELNNVIDNSSNTNIKINKWRINYLVEGNLKDILLKDSTKDNNKQGYLEAVKSKNNWVLTKVVEIKGFTSQINLRNKMSNKLKGGLKHGITINIGSKENGVVAEFKLKNDKKIEISSNSNFFVFGEYRRASKILK